MPRHTCKPPSELAISCVKDPEGWRQLGREWAELLANSTADCVFLSWQWLDTWMSVYGDGGSWLLIVVRDARYEKLLGVAPMMLESGTGKAGRWMQRLILVGQKADTASEYLDWIIRRGHEAEVIAAICDHLLGAESRSWDLLCFETMRADSPTLPLLERAFASRGEGLTISHPTNAPYLTLPGRWEDFLASRSGTFRTRWNKFHREHLVAVREAGVDLSVPEGMRIIRDLNEKRWGNRRQSFLSERYRRFHDEVSVRLHEAGHLAMIFLEADGQIVAGRYDFAYAGKAWCFQGGWLPEWEKERAGKMMLTAMMRRCIENGLSEYDFLGGEASYKNEWSSDTRPMAEIEAANPSSMRGRLYKALKRLKQSCGHNNGKADHREPC